MESEKKTKALRNFWKKKNVKNHQNTWQKHQILTVTLSTKSPEVEIHSG